MSSSATQSSNARAFSFASSRAPTPTLGQPALQRLNGANGKSEPAPLTDVSLREAGEWSGIRLEEWAFSSVGHHAQDQTQFLSHVVSVCLSGTCRTTGHISGEKPLQDSTTFPRNICICPAGRTFSANMTWESANSPTFLVMAIAPELLKCVSAGINGREVVLRPSTGVTDPFVLTTALSLQEDFRQSSPLGPIYGETLSVALATHLIRDYAELPNERLNDAAEIRSTCVGKIRDYIHAHIGDPISLADLAMLAGLEIHQIAKAFKRSFGVPPHRYIINTRIGLAKDLLKSSRLSLIDVAYRTGFANQGHFTTTFKRWTGLRPSEYRRHVT